MTYNGAGASCHFNDTAGSSMIVVTGEAACGAILDCSAQFGAGSVGNVGGRILCEDTGLYWDVATGTWVAWEALALTYAASPAPGAWVRLAANGVAVPNLTDRSAARIRVMLGMPFGVGQDAWIDDLRILSRANIITTHHPRNVQGTTLTLWASHDLTGAAWTQLASIPGSSARFDAWGQFAARSASRWRLRVQNPKPFDHVLPAPWGFVGAPAVGESVLALARWAIGTWRKVDDSYEVPQVRVGQAGRYRQAQAGGPYRRIVLERMGASTADWSLILNRLYLASLGGVRNSVLVWDEAVASRVIYGAVDAGLSLPFDVTAPNVAHELEVTGYAPPVWTT